MLLSHVFVYFNICHVPFLDCTQSLVVGVLGGVDIKTSALLSEDEEDTVVLDEGKIPKMPMSTASGKHSLSTLKTVASEKIVFPQIVSCMKPWVDEKTNSRKRALTGNATYIADAIIKFAKGSF